MRERNFYIWKKDISTSGNIGCSVSGNGGKSYSGNGGKSVSGKFGIVASGVGGELILSYFDKINKRCRTALAYIGEDGIEANFEYKLDENNKFVKV